MSVSALITFFFNANETRQKRHIANELSSHQRKLERKQLQHAGNDKQDVILAIKKLLPLICLMPPFLILYYLYPTSFEATWKGRTYYLFFIWLVSLETILNWEKLSPKWNLKSKKTIIIATLCVLPTVYIVASQLFDWNQVITSGLTKVITDIAAPLKTKPDYWAQQMPLSIEYVVFVTLFSLLILFEYEISDLRKYSISILFLGLIGMIYVTDNLYPYGKFVPFQMIVPTTARLTVDFLNLIGQSVVWLGESKGMPVIMPVDAAGKPLTPPFSIAWPCAGIDSLLIYSVTILLFLKETMMPLKHRIVYFAFGAIITYFINILRIVTIVLIAVKTGGYTAEVARFHDYYGQLYSMTWIISYPLLIIGSQTLWKKLKKKHVTTFNKA